MDEKACIKLLADCYSQRDAWVISQAIKDQFREEVEALFKTLPVEVRWISDEACPQPFHTAQQMREDYLKRGELLMLSEDSSELGRDLYSKHRAVHDWYGHICGNNPFGGRGESQSFLVHCHQYTPEVLPIVFSDVVLGNAFWQHNKRTWGGERWVYAPDLIDHVRTVFSYGDPGDASPQACRLT